MLYRLLEKQRQRNPQKTAIVSEQRSLTYDQLLKEARSTALYLREQGIRAGDYIVVGISPSPDFYILFYAASALGIILLPVPLLGKLSSRVKALGRVSIAGDQAFLRTVREAGLEVHSVIRWNRKTGLGISNLPGKLIRRSIVREANVLGVSTSGTTGEPVIFVRSAAELYHRARLRVEGMKIRRDDILLSVGPFTSGVNAVFHLVLPGGRETRTKRWAQ